ncbi:MAG: hypothetical protein KDC00_03615 [Flavobacteriales bacterium]|nr:hypothetical protein [Flavobacteriales bacterium]
MSTTTLLQDELIHRLMAEREGPCVTLLLPTHRTMPDAEKDKLVLRRLVEEAKQGVLEVGDKRAMASIVDRLNAIEGKIDHNHNGDGMAVFIASDLSEVVKLPFTVEERATVDGTFVTREVVRWRLGGVDHHVLVLGTKGAHLYHASNDRLLGEVREGFPMRNNHYTTDALATSTSRGQLNQLREYHVDVDRTVRQAVGEKGRVVVACTQEQYPQLVAEAARSAIYIGNVHGSHDNTPPAEVVKEAWTIAYEDQKNRHIADLEVLRKAPVEKHSTSIIDIWKQVREGRGMTLLVERDLRMAAKVFDDRIELVNDPKAPGVVDDIVDDIIEEQLRKGGDVRILPNGLLADYKGIALLLRY